MSWENVLIRKHAPIFKAKAPSKKVKKDEEEIKVPNGTVSLKNVLALKAVRTKWNEWVSKCNSLQLADIGVTGRGAEGNGKETLYEHVDYHILPEVQREGQGPRVGAKSILGDITKILDTIDVFHIEQDMEFIVKLLDKLKKIENNPDSNPKSIPFTEPDDRGKWPKTPNLFGHYRTVEYVKRRRAAGKTELDAVPSSWYSNDPKGPQTPPFWQALFASGEGTEIDWGLQSILQEAHEALKEIEVGVWYIDVAGAKMREGLEQINSFTKVMTRILKNPVSYQAHRFNKPEERPFKRITLNIASVIRSFTSEIFPLESISEIQVLKDRINGGGDLPKDLKIGAFQIRSVSATIMRTMLKNMFFKRREIDVNTFNGPYAKGIIISAKDPWSAREAANREQALQKKQEKEAKKKNRVKKSWSEILWGSGF